MSAFIFDVDGTLIDSYDGITKATISVLDKYNYKMDNVRRYILDNSVLDLFKIVSGKTGVEYSLLYDEYKKERIKTQFDYCFMKNAVSTLYKLKYEENKLFIFTHKGNAIDKILELDKLKELFDEVISSDSPNFKRKPDPYCINYLVEKYNLDKNDTYYVGDRRIDMECAKNANIKGIFYGKADDSIGYDIVISDFNELINCVK